MNLPVLNPVRKSRDYNIDFRGYNHGYYVPENQFYDTKNLCATAYPAMAPRALRGTVRTMARPQGLTARGKLAWVDYNTFYYDRISYGTTLTDGEKQLVGMGAYILIFPDGKRFHTLTHEWDSLGAVWTQDAPVSISLCKIDGEAYVIQSTGPEPPEDAQTGAIWLDTSGETHVLRILGNDGWTSVPTTYVKLEAEGIGTDFRTNDALDFSGLNEADLNGSHVVIGRTADALIITGLVDVSSVQESGIVIERRVPQMDFVCEKDNRIWGCSSEKHEIYACALGDPTNWYRYGTSAGDSYAVTVGSDGDFTGCAAYAGYVFFFKEECIHKLMGDKPSNFQLFASPGRGVQKGSERSLCIVNEALLYKARDAVVTFDGGSPMSVSDALGHVDYFEAAAGAQGNRYYISMRDMAGEWSLFVFDEEKGLWYREDALHVKQFAGLNGQLYMQAEDGRLLAVRGTMEPGAELETGLEWYAETGDLMVTTPDNKYISRIQVRAGVDRDSRLKLEAQYDSDGIWHTIYEHGYSRKASFTAPIVPMRCDHFRLRISGKGKAVVYGISKEYEEGSEL